MIKSVPLYCSPFWNAPVVTVSYIPGQKEIQVWLWYVIVTQFKWHNKTLSNRCWGYSSVAEHSTADREVPGSNPGAPSLFSFKTSFFIFFSFTVHFHQIKCQCSQNSWTPLKALLSAIHSWWLPLPMTPWSRVVPQMSTKGCSTSWGQKGCLQLAHCTFSRAYNSNIEVSEC